MKRAVLLDVDGTLVDSNDAHARAWVDALAEGGQSFPVERVRRLIGKGGDKLLPELTGIEVDSERGEELVARKKEIFERTYLPTLRALPGARALLERLIEDKVTLVVATSAGTDELESILAVAGLDDLLPRRTSSDDAERSKPDPDIVAVALKKSGARAEHTVMLGDTPYDVEAATRAGVGIVGLRSGGWDDEALAGALACYDDPADLLAALDDSPLARLTRTETA